MYVVRQTTGGASWANGSQQPTLAVGNGQASYLTGGTNQLVSLPSGDPRAAYRTGPGRQTTTNQATVASGNSHATGAAVVAGTQPQPLQSSTTGGVPLVSLGCNCGSKGAFKELGYGAETLPFDWMCTTLEGVMKFISNDFQGFFDFQSISPQTVSGVNFTLYRSYCHSFWHDDLNDPAEVEKYQRRIKRFCGLSANNSPVLFVRLAASTDEIGQIGSLSSLLKQKFGPRAMLLHILDLQGSNPPGPCIIAGLDNVLLYYLPTTSGGYEKYGPAINAGLAWVAGRPATTFKQLPNLDAACALAVPTNWGHFGMGGIPAFEDSRPQQAQQPAQLVEGKPEVQAKNGIDSAACALAVPTNWGHFGMGGIPAFEDSRPQPAQLVEGKLEVQAKNGISSGASPQPPVHQGLPQAPEHSFATAVAPSASPQPAAHQGLPQVPGNIFGSLLAPSHPGYPAGAFAHADAGMQDSRQPQFSFVPALPTIETPPSLFSNNLAPPVGLENVLKPFQAMDLKEHQLSNPAPPLPTFQFTNTFPEASPSPPYPVPVSDQTCWCPTGLWPGLAPTGDSELRTAHGETAMQDAVQLPFSLAPLPPTETLPTLLGNNLAPPAGFEALKPLKAADLMEQKIMEPAAPKPSHAAAPSHPRPASVPDAPPAQLEPASTDIAATEQRPKARRNKSKKREKVRQSFTDAMGNIEEAIDGVLGMFGRNARK